MSRCAAFFSGLLLTLTAGCVPRDGLPTHPRMSVDETRRILARRAESVKTISSQATITLTRPDGESIRFDGAIALRPPDRSRLRAWKFGQAVFDLTVTPDGVWIIAPDDPKHRQDIRRAGATAADFGRTFSSLLGSFFSSADLTGAEHGDMMRFTHKSGNGAALTCEVDRRTLTPRRYRLLDDGSKRGFT
ncbi:MAG: hypothetical protein H0U59_13250, partial [Gemmatimonadaceae bacterium]|nr:hypothetical protein [Gemmatimonadaceae bacterium]